MQEQLADEILKTSNTDALTSPAQALVTAGSIEQAQVAALRINDPGGKARALQSLDQAAGALNDPERAAGRLEGLRSSAEGIDEAWRKADSLPSLAQAALELDPPGFVSG